MEVERGAARNYNTGNGATTTDDVLKGAMTTTTNDERVYERDIREYETRADE